MGIAIITAFLVILLSAFNGIETMIENLYSEFDTDITVRVEKGKFFNENRLDITALKSIDGVADVSRVIEEVVILKRNEKWVDAKLLGVENSFLRMTHTSDHIAEGKALLTEKGQNYGIIGAKVLEKLEGYIPKQIGEDRIYCYIPKRDAKVGFRKSPFHTNEINLSGSVNYNREVNAQFLIVPMELAKEMMRFDDEISGIFIDAKPGVDNEDLKSKIQKIVGPDFVVKTSYEKNELIYQTSQTERIIVLIILLFIFVLAAFNLVASLTMLFVEKLENVKTMIGFGTPRKFVFRIFFFEGLLISGRGIFFGLILGYLVCFLQIKFGLITMPNSNGEAFPVNATWEDGVLIFVLVSILAVLFSYFPVKYLIRKNIN